MKRFTVFPMLLIVTALVMAACAPAATPTEAPVVEPEPTATPEPEVMAMGSTFQESLQKALRGLETDKSGLDPIIDISIDDSVFVANLESPSKKSFPSTITFETTLPSTSI